LVGVDTCFNPRARAGRDGYVKNIILNEPVSIHAPARGATFTSPSSPLITMFQSTRPRGARQKVLRSSRVWNGFNPRARAGRDLCYRVMYGDNKRFNPRARAGRDHIPAKDDAIIIVSIHAPARGATGSPYS